jgi:hypothetical protein
MIVPFFFFFKQIYIWGPYFIKKKPFQHMIKPFFFSFFKQIQFLGLIPLRKNHFSL